MDLSRWTLDALRGADFDGIIMNWLEEARLEWTSLLAPKLAYFMSGASFVLICDEEYEWFERYFLNNINGANKARPYLPFVSLKALYPHINEINSKEEMQLLEDMLSISFSNGFMYFYIGKGSNKLSLIAKSRENSYMWLFGEQAQNSFTLNANDALLDVKLLSLFKLFDKTLSELLLGKISL